MVNIHRIHNPLDVAPYAWTSELRQTVPELYSNSTPRTRSNPIIACQGASGKERVACPKPNLKPNTIEKLLFHHWNDQLEGHGYAQVHPGYPKLCKTTMPLKERTFAKQGFWQHHYGYLYGLDMLTQDDGVCKPCAASMAKNFCNEAGPASDD